MDARKNNFGVLIQHPQMNPDEVTQRLGLIPSGAANVGDLVTTPSGRQPGSRHKWSFWGHFENFEDEILEERVLILIDRLALHKDFFEKIANEKGHATFIVRSSEKKHVVCSLSPETLAKLVDLNVTLEFEVFKPTN